MPNEKAKQNNKRGQNLEASKAVARVQKIPHCTEEFPKLPMQTPYGQMVIEQKHCKQKVEKEKAKQNKKRSANLTKNVS